MGQPFDPNAMTLTQYAAHLSVSDPYIAKLKREGRLVLNADGKIIQPESDRRLADEIDWPLEAVRGSSKIAKALRALGLGPVESLAVTPPPSSPVREQPAVQPDPEDQAIPADLNQAEASAGPLVAMRLRREAAEAQRAELKLLEELKLVVSKAEVEAELGLLFKTLRESLLSVPGRICPRMSIPQEQQLQLEYELTREISAALNELADRAGIAAEGADEC